MRTYIILSILIICGLVLLLVQTAVLPNTFWYNTFGNIANTFLVGGTLSLLYNLLLKQEDEKNLLRMLKISFSVHDSGLRQIMTDSGEYKFSSLLVSSQKFIVVMNDGQRWVGNHSPQLEERFNTKGKETEFYFVDPNGVFIDALAKKTEVDIDTLKNKITQTVGLLERTYERSQKQGKLKVYYLKNYPTQTVFLTEDVIIVTPYQIASGRNIIPLYEYAYKEGKKSIGYHISTDIENVSKESSLILEKPGV